MAVDAVRLVEYEIDGTEFEAAVVGADSGPDAHPPTVLVFHGMEGRSEAQVEVAKRLTGWGYSAIAVDMFGREATNGGIERCGQEMTALMHDRGAMRDRLTRVVDVLAEVDRNNLAAIGFCFGGLCAIDLARCGCDIAGIASFHGVLTPPDWTSHDPITAKVIVFHGWDDPYATPDEMLALGRELTARQADWQIHAFGATMHSFMAPTANNPDAGIQYNATSATRAWTSLGEFLRELFG